MDFALNGTGEPSWDVLRVSRLNMAGGGDKR